MGEAARIKKLGTKPGQRAAVINPPDGYADRIGPTQGVEVTTDLDGTFDFVQAFARIEPPWIVISRWPTPPWDPAACSGSPNPKGSSKVRPT